MATIGMIESGESSQRPRSTYEKPGRDPRYETAVAPRPLGLVPLQAAPLSTPYMSSEGMLAGNIDSYLQDRSLPRADSPRFQETLHLHGLQTEDHLRIQPQIEAKIDKGFFVSGDGVWTCYRRNYFTVICSYLLQPSGSFGQLYFYNRGDDVGTPTRKAVKALSMCIRAEVAEVDGTGKSIELIQHSPKRDRGSVVSIIPVPMWPTTETTEHANKRWSLLLQDVRDPWIHGFDRIQFKQATANNGKRRAKQHYFTIVIELLCDIRENAESNPVWITVAQRRSEPVVVRGRSPSHYAKELHNSEILRGTYGVNTNTPYGSGEHIRPYHEVSPVLHQHAVPSVFSHRNSPAASHLPTEAVELDPIAEDTIQQNLFDDSSVSSYVSRTEDPSRPPTRSSITSTTDDRSTTEQFVALLLEFDGIRGLLAACFALDEDVRAERNIRRLLKLLAVKLRFESSRQTEVTVARVLKRQSRQIAQALSYQFCLEPSNKAHLPLHTIPTSPGYTMERFLAPHHARSSEKESTNVAENDQARQPPTNGGRLGALEENIYQRVGTDGYTAQKTSTTMRFQDPTSIKTPDTFVRKGIDPDVSSGSSDASSDIINPQDNEGTSDVLIRHGKDFVRNSEALEEFREGLLDLRVGLENALRNKELVDQSSQAGIPEQGKMPTNARLKDYSLYLRSSWMNWWRYFRHLQRQFRPPVKPDMRRMEWTCACGEDLFADFQDDDPVAFNELHAALMAGSTLTNSVGGTASFPSSSTPDTTTQVPVSSSSASPLRQRYPQPSSGNIPAQMLRAPLGVTETNQAPPPRYLAVSSSFGGIYKGLSELDISQLKSDAQLFMAVATIYLELSSWRRLRRIFLKPVSVEFVQLSVWDVHKGYVSISDRPACVPPENEPNYDFAPRPLAPLPPVPPEIFVHYLGHRGGSHNPASNRFVWTPRLPTRKLKRLIDCDVPTYGWGIFIKEGPNRLLIFWMAILSVVCSVLLSILWATLKGDVQGASGLGSLILGVHSVIMAVFMFRFGELS